MSKLSEGSSITRKDFIRTGTLGALGLAGLGLNEDTLAAVEEDASKETEARYKAKVVLARSEAAMKADGLKDREVVKSLLGQALCAYTGEKTGDKALGHFIRPGDTVGVKMNVMMNATNQELVAALVEFLLTLGVKEKKIIVWDRNKAGLGLEGAFNREKQYGYGPDAVSRIVTDETTALINIPALKSHWLSGAAGAVKNWCGAVTKINVRDIDTPFPIHKDSCADMGMLGALEPVRSKMRLVILDALRPLFEGGPQVNPAYLWQYGGLFIGEDQVAVDAVCIRLLSRKREQYKGRPWPMSPPPKHVALAGSRYGLGCADMDKINLVKVGAEKDRLI